MNNPSLLPAIEYKVGLLLVVVEEAMRSETCRKIDQAKIPRLSERKEKVFFRNGKWQRNSLRDGLIILCLEVRESHSLNIHIYIFSVGVS